MILLEKGNRILGEAVSNKINFVPTEDEKAVEPMDVKLCDFDDVSYRVTIDTAARNIMLVSMNLPCYTYIEKNGAKDAFEKFYGGYKTDPVTGYDLTLKINIDDLKEQKQKDDLVEKISCLKTNVLAGVFDYYFTALLTNPGKPPDPFKFDLRSDTTIYFFPKSDRVTIIYSIDFKEKTDKAIAKIFMQEFVEARRGLGAAPPVTWSVNPPMELAHFKITEPTGNLGFISFAVQKSNIDKDKKDRVISVLQAFRNYLQYHIKCSKAYFHSRMRARVASFLQVLNRAKFDRGQETEKKTISGRTFVRQNSAKE